MSLLSQVKTKDMLPYNNKVAKFSFVNRRATKSSIRRLKALH